MIHGYNIGEYVMILGRTIQLYGKITEEKHDIFSESYDGVIEIEILEITKNVLEYITINDYSMDGYIVGMFGIFGPKFGEKIERWIPDNRTEFSKFINNIYIKELKRR